MKSLYLYFTPSGAIVFTVVYYRPSSSSNRPLFSDLEHCLSIINNTLELVGSPQSINHRQKGFFFITGRKGGDVLRGTLEVFWKYLVCVYKSTWPKSWDDYCYHNNQESLRKQCKISYILDFVVLLFHLTNHLDVASGNFYLLYTMY